MKKKVFLLASVIFLAGCSRADKNEEPIEPIFTEVANAAAAAGMATAEPTPTVKTATEEAIIVATATPEAKRYSIEYNGKKFSVQDDLEEVKNCLGEVKREETFESIAFVGTEKAYRYDDGITLVTYPGDTKDYVEVITVNSDKISTGEGIKVGSTKEELQKAYGKSLEEGKNDSYSCKIDNTELRFLLLNDKVAAINFYAPIKNKKLTSDKSKPVIGNTFETTLYTNQENKETDLLKYIRAWDEVDACPTIVADVSTISVNKKGSYTVRYYAYDRAGNRSEASVAYNVVSDTTNAVEVDKVDKIADQVLSKIITEDMTTQKKCTAIYNWIRSNFNYTESSEKSNWVKAANDGLKRKSGDCYVYYSVAQELLYRAGVMSMLVQKNPGHSSTHYWNLVYVPKQGWYHFDTTPRVGGGDDFNLVTDDWLINYSKNHGSSHDFDTSKYPNTPKEKVKS